MNSKEALCEILSRTDKKESEYIIKCAEIIARDLVMLEVLKKDRRISKLWPSEEFIEYPTSDTESVSKGLLDCVMRKLGW